MISNERLFLEAATGVDVDAVAQGAYAQVYDGAGVLIEPDFLATNGHCVDCTIPMVNGLNEHFEPESGFRAWGAIHDIDDMMDHCYASVDTPSGSPFTDIIIDLTYKQFLNPSDRALYPNVFVGSRKAIIDLMLEHASDSTSHIAYLPDTLSPTAGLLGRERGTPFKKSS